MTNRSAALLVLIPCVTAACALHPGTNVRTLPGPVPLNASTVGSSYGIQMRVEGWAAVENDWLYVTIPKGAIRTYQGTAPAWDLMLRAVLMTCAGDRQAREVSVSQPARLAQVVGFTRDSSMLDTAAHAFRDTVRLDLGVPATIDPSHSWIAFQLAWPVSSVIASYEVPTNLTLAQTGGVESCAAVHPSPPRRPAQR